jgi:hypothetical protein
MNTMQIQVQLQLTGTWIHLVPKLKTVLKYTATPLIHLNFMMLGHKDNLKFISVSVELPEQDVK